MISKESLERLEMENPVKRLHRQSFKNGSQSPKKDRGPALLFVKESRSSQRVESTHSKPRSDPLNDDSN